ncbi:MAG TPA: diacylglycerol kinase family protein [Ktedonobacteraceae bacterium]|nr:diacylglycerol kinase family protein [Ktedonobacteraceae bacterium]
MQEMNNVKGSPPTLSQATLSAVILANEKSGSFPKEANELEDTLAYLREQGWQVELRYTHSIEDARQKAREAVQQKADMLIAVGGDGTINTVIQELAGSETALGVIPSGTFNVWANETGIPLDIKAAREVLVHGKTRKVDLGHVQDRYFLLMAGIGFGGTVTYAVKKQSLKWLGPLGYLLTGIRLGLGYDSFKARLTIDGRSEDVRALQIVVGNTQLYGALLKFTWRAKCDDGLFDVCIVRSPGKFERVLVMLDFLLRSTRRRKWIRYLSCKTFEIQTRTPVNFQVDGEPIGRTPATFTIVPGALKVVVPEKPPEALYTKDSL